MRAAGSLASPPASQVGGEKARGARIRRALCDSVRDAAAFSYRARVRVSVVRVVARSNERHCARSRLPRCARNDRAQVARATRAARHSRARCWHVANCAREACSTNAGVTDVAARRRALRLPQSSESPRGDAALGFRCGRTCCCIPNLEHILFKRACNNCATLQVFSRARRQQLALHGRTSCNDKSMQSCSAGRCKMLPTRPCLRATMARNGLGAEGRNQNY